MAYWLHRISHQWHISKPLFDKGILTIGWRILAENNISIDNFDLLTKDYGRSRWSLFRFLKMLPNDTVIVPLYNGTFAIANVVSSAKPVSNLFNDCHISDKEKEILKNKNTDIGYYIKLDNIKVIPRSYADAILQRRMKIRDTNADLNDLRQAIERARLANGSVNIHDIISDSIVGKICEHITERITPDHFELLIKWYFEKCGASKAYRPAKNAPSKVETADADIIAEFDNLGIVFYVQAKQHKGKTDQWALEQIVTYIQNLEPGEASYTYIPWVISTGSFNDDTINKAIEYRITEGINVRLVDGIEFSKMLMDIGISSINEIVEKS